MVRRYDKPGKLMSRTFLHENCLPDERFTNVVNAGREIRARALVCLFRTRTSVFGVALEGSARCRRVEEHQPGISFWKAVTHRAAFTLSCDADPALPPYAHARPPDVDIALRSRPKRHLIEYVVHAVRAAYTLCIGANPLRGATVVRGDRTRCSTGEA